MNLYVTCALCFGLGYVLGRLDSFVRRLRDPVSDSFVAQVVREEKTQKSRRVSIDESKFVTDMSTDGMESIGSPSLGTVTQTEDSISLAASKLAQLKKLKG